MSYQDYTLYQHGIKRYNYDFNIVVFLANSSNVLNSIAWHLPN